LKIGFFTLKFVDAPPPTRGKVSAFEPVPASAASVRDLQNQYPWVHLYQCAAADLPGEVEMSVDAGSISPNHIITIGEPLGG
jgi:hypothetical protein